MAQPARQERDDRLKSKEVLAYGSGDLGMSLAWSLLGTFTTFYLTNVMGISAAIAGSVILFSKIFSGIADLLVGVAVDRTRTKMGKARPWMYRWSIPLGISFVLFFTVPHFEMTGKIIWTIITYNLMSTVFYTLVNIPYGTLSPLMTRDSGSRVKLNIARMLCGVCSGVIAASITLPVVNALGGDALAWTKVAACYAIIMTLLVLLSARFTKERYSFDESPEENAKLSIKQAVPFLFSNKFWLIMLLSQIAFFVLQGISNGVNVYYFKYILGNENAVGLAAVSMALPMLAAILLSPSLVKKYGKGKMALFSAFCGICVPLIVLIDPTSLPIILIKSALTGITLAPFASVGFAMLADVCDYSYWKTGIKTEALINSAASFGAKAGIGVGSASIGWILAAGSFDASLPIQPESAITAMKFMMIGLPAILSLLQFLALMFYNLDKIYPTIIKDIEDREQRKAGI